MVLKLERVEKVEINMFIRYLRTTKSKSFAHVFISVQESSAQLSGSYQGRVSAHYLS